MITPARLREVLDYDKLTGEFTWRIQLGSQAIVGQVAGTTSLRGYVEIVVDGKSYRANRLAFLHINGVWPSGDADHKSGVKSDNSWDNLRDVSHRANGENRVRANSNSKLGVLGVTQVGEKFYPRIRVAGRLIHLGTFDTVESAHSAYLSAKRERHAGCLI